MRCDTVNIFEICIGGGGKRVRDYQVDFGFVAYNYIPVAFWHNYDRVYPVRLWRFAIVKYHNSDYNINNDVVIYILV